MKNHSNFLFSLSTCALQVEGGRNEGGRTDSIWDEFTKRNFFIPSPEVPGREINSIATAADLYHKYRTDCRIMQRMGLKSLVYNMDWTRIFPKNATELNPEGIKFYDDFFAQLNTHGVKPVPILFHWDTPLWAEIQGGWTNRSILDAFRYYVRAVFRYLGKYSDIWFVNDENSTFTLDGYLGDFLPPAKNNPRDWVLALHHLNLSAAIAKEEFLAAKKAGYVAQDAKLGIDHDWCPPIPYDAQDAADLQACQEYNAWFKNLFLDPNFKGTYPQVFLDYMTTLGVVIPEWTADLSFLKRYPMDLIGWNYYRPCYITHKNKTLDPTSLKRGSVQFPFGNFQQVFPLNNVQYTSWNWIIDPSQIEPGGRILNNEYQVPLMILENGIGRFENKTDTFVDDWERIEFLKVHLQACLDARTNGVDFIGFSIWTYCDIFSPSGGYRKKYGLIAVDFDSPIKIRSPKLSYVWYKNVITSVGTKLDYTHDELVKDLNQELASWDLWLK